MLSSHVRQNWVRIDESNRLLTERFVGSLAELQAHLTSGICDVPVDFTASGRETLYLDDFARTTECYVLVMEIPWGIYRWIPEPPQNEPSRSRFQQHVVR